MLHLIWKNAFLQDRSPNAATSFKELPQGSCYNCPTKRCGSSDGEKYVFSVFFRGWIYFLRLWDMKKCWQGFFHCQNHTEMWALLFFLLDEFSHQILLPLILRHSFIMLLPKESITGNFTTPRCFCLALPETSNATRRASNKSCEESRFWAVAGGNLRQTKKKRGGANSPRKFRMYIYIYLYNNIIIYIYIFIYIYDMYILPEN